MFAPEKEEEEEELAGEEGGGIPGRAPSSKPIKSLLNPLLKNKFSKLTCRVAHGGGVPRIIHPGDKEVRGCACACASVCVWLACAFMCTSVFAYVRATHVCA